MRKSAGSYCAIQATWLKLIQDSALLFDLSQESVLSSLLLPCWLEDWSL